MAIPTYVNATNICLSISCRTVVDVVVKATRLSLEQRRKVAAWIEAFQSPTLVRTKYQACFNCDPQEASVVREHERSSPKINVWCAVTAAGVVGPYFFENDTVTGADILLMLETCVADNLPLRILLTGYFQLDGAPPHFARVVRNYLYATFQRRWIGRGEISRLHCYALLEAIRRPPPHTHTRRSHKTRMKPDSEKQAEQTDDSGLKNSLSPQ
ncbi:hypothetical protein PR048_024893 [Dryococelus australis]|uniref:Transposase n=1 Tax=Dryococelus australis TaxID=614101 RepID=A0ABQ9GPU7_9NEOP|nr:hypothetical protein PR048_024893 [Dryococelus australis]